jgi:hypothetical protein
VLGLCSGCALAVLWNARYGGGDNVELRKDLPYRLGRKEICEM